ncbi:MAG: ATP-binding protein [Oceanococcaceae bacterium]
MRHEIAWTTPELYRSIVDSIGSTLCVINEDSTIVFVNRAWQQFARENGGQCDTIGRSYLHACRSATGASHEGGATVAGGIRAVICGALPAFDCEYPCHSPREMRWFNMSVRPLVGEGLKLFVIKHSNITSRKLAELALHAKNGELARSNRDLDQFAYIASHDLQEPLRSVATMANFLAEDPQTTLSAAGVEARSFMLASCARMQELIRGLLEYGRIGHLRAPATTNLNTVLNDVLKDMQTRIQERQAIVEIATEMPCLTLYSVEMRLLLQNLISNAIKFCPPARVPHIVIRAQQLRPHRWRFSVQDNGIGVAPDARERIFMIFQRAPESLAFQGSGIGLAHCQKIAELHGGRIWLESSSDQGSIFCVDIEDLSAPDDLCDTPAAVDPHPSRDR